MKLRPLSASLLVATSIGTFALARSARADDESPAEIPAPTPGESAAPPVSPSEVPAPVAPEKAQPNDDTPGTTSKPMHHGEHHGGGGFAGYSASGFYLKDPAGNFVLMPTGRLQFDFYGFAGPGVSDYQRSSNGTGLKDFAFAKRARVELAGRFLQRWYFWIAADVGNQSVDGTQKAATTAAAADNFIGVEIAPELRIQVGQFDLPFTMENITSDKWLSFMERSLTVRAVGAPYNKDLGIMARGVIGGVLDWAVAAVGGDGQNRPNIDNRADVAARLSLFPATSIKEIERFHIGVSGRWGRRDPTAVRYDAPGLSTPGGYTFWSPTYSNVHVIPSNTQAAIAAELFFPWHRFELQAEAVMLSEGRRESNDCTGITVGCGGNLGNPERSGTLSGLSYYVQAAYWPLGKPRLPGEPGTYPNPKWNGDHARIARALQVVARWEQLFLDYDSVARSNDDAGVLISGVKRGSLDANTTKVRVNALQLAATYWATKHVRVTAQGSLYTFPGIPGIDNQAAAPGTKANAKDPDARSLVEISLRVAVAI